MQDKWKLIPVDMVAGHPGDTHVAVVGGGGGVVHYAEPFLLAAAIVGW